MRHLLLFTLLIIQLSAFADSPLTSTFFARAYREQPLIADILLKRDSNMIYRFDIGAPHLAFFDRTDIPLDQKIALVNAMGWDENGNIKLYINHLSKKYAISPSDIELALADPGFAESSVPDIMLRLHYHDLVLLGYMQAMHDYFIPFKALGVLELAVYQNPQSEATAWVHALILSQDALDWDWCRVYTVFEDAIAQPYETDLIREAGKTDILEYINLYASSCESVPDSEWQTIEPESEELPGWTQWTEENFNRNPVYAKPAAPQISTKKEKVNLKLLNSDKPPYLYVWLDYNSDIESTVMTVYLQNTGNATSIPTNLALIIFADDNNGMPELHYQTGIPELQPNEQNELMIYLPGYWIYDPDANFKIILDYDNNIQEADEKDNEGTFSEWG